MRYLTTVELKQIFGSEGHVNSPYTPGNTIAEQNLSSIPHTYQLNTMLQSNKEGKVTHGGITGIYRPNENTTFTGSIGMDSNGNTTAQAGVLIRSN